MHKTRCAFFTSTRADYGLIAPVARALSASTRYEPSYIVAGTHLSFDYGHTLDEIDTQYAPITATLQTLIRDTEGHLDVPATLGVTIQETANALRKQKPDLLFVAGDRYEVFGAAIAANLTNTPLAHLYGGDISHGAYDDSFRHAITKFAHLHFTTNDSSAQRVVQMGEDPSHVHCVGSPALDTLAEFKALDIAQLSHALGIELSGDYFLVSIHPATRDSLSPQAQADTILSALTAYAETRAVSYIFTMPCADDGGAIIANAIKDYCETHVNAHFFHSFAHTHYLSLMKHSAGVIGNSSSGLYEAPSFKVPTLNIGSRQKGRLMADSVINCGNDSTEIARAIQTLRTLDTSKAVNPYGRGNASQQIVSILDTYDSFAPLIMKPFHMLPASVLSKLAAAG